MRLLNTLGALIAVSLLAVPAFAEPPPELPSKAAAAQRAKGEKREARLVEALKKEGIAEAKAKRVVGVIKKSKPAMRAARQEQKSAKQALRNDAKDAAAQKRLAAAEQKLEAIRKQNDAELAKFLSASEKAKVHKLVQRGKHHGKHKGKHHGKQKGEQKGKPKRGA
jgi:hypothetical protein